MDALKSWGEKVVTPTFPKSVAFISGYLKIWVPAPTLTMFTFCLEVKKKFAAVVPTPTEDNEKLSSSTFVKM